MISVRLLLIGLALAALIPLLLLLGFVLTEYSSAETQRYEMRALRTAQNTAARLDRELERVRLALVAIAAAPDDAALRASMAKEVEQSTGGSVTLSLADKDSLTLLQLAEGSIPSAPGSFLSDLILEEGQRPVIWAAVPVPNGRLEGRWVLARIDPARLGTTVLNARTEEAWIVAIIDRSDHIVWRSRNPLQHIGKLATQDLRENTLGREGVWHGSTLEGEPVLGAYSRSQLSSYRIAVGAPEAEVEAPLRTALLLFAALAAIAFAASFLLSRWISGHIVRPLAALAERGADLPHGGFVPLPQSPVREIASLGQTLSSASAELRHKREERDRALQDLASSEHRLAQILDDVPLAIVQTDSQGNWTYANPAAERLLKLSSAEYLGRAYDSPQWGLTTPEGDALDSYDLPSARALRGERVVDYAHAIRDPETGEEKVLSVSSVPVHDSAGQIIGSIAALVDATSRHAAEEALKRSEERLRDITDAMPVLISYVDRDQIFRFVNKSYEQWFGRPIEQIEGHHISDVMGDAMYSQRRKMVERALNGEAVTYEVQFSAGPQVRSTTVQHIPHVGPDGSIAGMYALVQDVTQLKQSEAEARAGRERLSAVLDAAPAVILMASDPSCLEVTGNQQAYELLRVPPGENLSKSAPQAPRNFLVLDREGQELGAEELPMQRAAGGETIMAHEEVITFDDGTEVHLLGNAVPLRNAEGQLWGAVAAYIDITERKRSEEHQRLLINELNHRVKNTLAIVQGLAQQSFRSGVPLDDSRNSFAARLSALAAAHDVLTRKNWESAILGETISDAVRATTGALASRVRLEGPEVVLPPQAAVSFAMAVHELSTNAVKYGALSNEAGAVSVAWYVVAMDGTKHLHLEWIEEGGPPVTAPNNKGFGSRMIERGLAKELHGSVQLDFCSAGLHCVIDAPLP